MVWGAAGCRTTHAWGPKGNIEDWTLPQKRWASRAECGTGHSTCCPPASQGVTKFRAKIGFDNAASQALFQQLGYREVGRVEVFREVTESHLRAAHQQGGCLLWGPLHWLDCPFVTAAHCWATWCR